MSCASAGSCEAGGGYTDSHGGYQGFVASERNGVWGQAIEVPGLGTLNAGNENQYAYVWSLSCASAGNCAAGGSFGNPSPRGFVASERNGVWGQAIEVLGLAALGGLEHVYSVSCASAGNCAAGGVSEGLHAQQGFVAAERNGVWGQATGVPGLAALTKGFDGVDSVSCASAGSCAVGGSYLAHRGAQGFVT